MRVIYGKTSRVFSDASDAWSFAWACYKTEVSAREILNHPIAGPFIVLGYALGWRMDDDTLLIVRDED